jgi:hypothetical protein
MTPLTVEDIPGPKGLPLVGNMFAVPAERTIQTLMEIVREYGPMVRLRTPVGDRFVASPLYAGRSLQDHRGAASERRRRRSIATCSAACSPAWTSAVDRS